MSAGLTDQSEQCSVQWTVGTLHCSVHYILKNTLCSVQCTGYTFQCEVSVDTLQCAVFRVHFAMCDACVHIDVCSLQGILCDVQCVCTL